MKRETRMTEKKTSLAYKIVKWGLKVCYGNVASFGTEHLPEEPCIIAGNHCQLNGPISCELFFPIPRYTWCAGEMHHMDELPDYCYRDFWSFKPKRSRWYYKLMSYPTAWLLHFLCKNANTIGVYRDARVMGTFKKTVRTLADGYSVVIFPERNQLHNHIIYDFQDRFIDVARLYYKQTGKALAFTPMYIAPRLRQLHLGVPTYFRPDVPMDEERERIKTYLMESITALAEALPRHTVVPYRNIPRRLYPKNIPDEVT